METTLLANRYRLEKRIGIGGMAYVYEAEDILLKRKVAVKILKQQFVEDDEFVKKFENEAQSAASLSHANIVNVYDVGREMVDGKPQHFIVMELIEGTTLKEAIETQGKFSNTALARISRQIAKALQCAHDNNIVHRDIKPANILITRDGDIKVTDFGIARISTAATITYTSSILGTVHYISPEQAKGRYIDQKSDIYSLGVVMYEMATGKVPFDAENSVGIAIQHIQEEPIPPIERNPELDPGLNHIILKCLQKEPINRYFDANELCHDLENYRNLRDTEVMENTLLGSTEKIPNVRAVVNEAVYETKRPTPQEYEPPRKKSVKWIVFLVLFAIVSTIGLVAAMGKFNQSQLEKDTTRVPNVVNTPKEEAIGVLEGRKLVPVVVGEAHDDTIPSGYVLEQNILPSTTVNNGTEVEMIISLGKEEIPVPDVSGLPLDEAVEEIETANFKTSIQYEESDTVKEGIVISTTPSSKEKALPGSAVTLTISKGKVENTTTVPTLTARQQADAMNTIAQAGLVLGSVDMRDSSYEKGVVIHQSIEPGEEVERGTTIDIVVSMGPKASVEASSSETSESASSEPQRQRMKYNYNIYPPAGKESFVVEIVDLSTEPATVLYNETLQSNTVNAEGYIVVSVVAYVDSNIEIRYDGEPVGQSQSQ